MSDDKKPQRYFGAWSCWEDMARELVGTYHDESTNTWPLATPDKDFPTDDEVIVAGYETEPYSGSSTIIFTRNGKLYEDSSSHCSCNGLEWGGGSEISWEYLDKRIADGYFYGLSTDGTEALKRVAVERITGQEALTVYASTDEKLSESIADLTDYSLLDPLAGLKTKPSA